MNFDRNTLIAGGVAALILLGGLGYWFLGKGGSSPDSEVVTGDCKPIETVEVTDADFTLGKADAPITFVEYASMTCPHCAQFSSEVLPLLKANYVDKGYVRYVFREYPLDTVALTVSVVGRCLQKDAYIPYVEMMYTELQTWARGEDLRGNIKEMARRAGMSGDEFEKCLKSEDDAKRVIAVRAKAIKDYCVGSTPTFLVNGKVIGSGEILWTDLDAKLREAAKEKGVTIPAAATDAAAPAEGAVTAPAEGAAAPAADGAASTPTDGAATPAEPATAPPAP
ncbi:MAG: thioredoxin domain-containing protein [Micropepsaceae bacterium]